MAISRPSPAMPPTPARTPSPPLRPTDSAQTARLRPPTPAATTLHLDPVSSVQDRRRSTIALPVRRKSLPLHLRVLADPARPAPLAVLLGRRHALHRRRQRSVRLLPVRKSANGAGADRRSRERRREAESRGRVYAGGSGGPDVYGSGFAGEICAGKSITASPQGREGLTRGGAGK